MRKWFNYEFVHPRFAQNFAFHPPWGDCREISLIKPNGPKERPPPPRNADESSLRTPESYPDELTNRQRNAIKRAKKAEKQKAHEEENLHLLKDDVEKKKAEGKFEGRTKRKHDPGTPASKRKRAPKQKKAQPADEFEMSDSSDDDPPLTKEEVAATLSEQVNVTTSTILPDLRAPVVPQAPSKKITARKTPATTVMMKQHVNTTPHPNAIDLKDLIVDAPVSTAKPGEAIPKPALKKIKAPTTEKDAPPATAPKEKAAKFAPILTQPLASKSPSEQVPVQTAPVAESDAPHYYNHIFIMEQLDKFVDNPFDGEVASLPIPAEVVVQATSLVHEMREDVVEINTLSAELIDLDGRMKTASSKFVIKELEASYKDINRALTLLHHRRLRFHMDLDEIVRKIYDKHQAQVTSYNDLVKGHIDQVAQQKRKQRKKVVKKNAPPAMKEKSHEQPVAQSQKEKTPKLVIPLEPTTKDSDAPPSPRPTESVPVASPARAKISSQWSVSEEGEIPRSGPQASLAHGAPKVLDPSITEQQQIPEEQPQPPPVQASAPVPPVDGPASAAPPVVTPAPSPLKLTIDTATKNLDAGPSERKSISGGHADSVVYGDEFLSPEEVLKYPNPREELPLFSSKAGAKGPLFNRNAHPKFFQDSPYDGPRTLESPRFWTKEQAIYYSRVLYESKKIFPHEYLNIPAMWNIGCFNQLLQALDDFCLTKVFEFEHPWNREIILQFYATLYISGDESDSSKWIMEWMTEGKRIKCTSTDFVSHFHFPRFEHGDHEIRVHSIDVISDETFWCTMDPEKIRDYSGPPRPEHLTFENQTLYHMLSYTICPLAGMNPDKSISDVLRNAIYAICERYIFDVEDMFLHILKDSAQYPFCIKVFAPWI